MAAGSPWSDREMAVPNEPHGLQARPASQPPIGKPQGAPAGSQSTASASLALGLGIRPADDRRQLKHLSPQVLHLRSQKQILAILHRQNGISYPVWITESEATNEIFSSTGPSSAATRSTRMCHQ